jgi:hypothetical protein
VVLPSGFTGGGAGLQPRFLGVAAAVPGPAAPGPALPDLVPATRRRSADMAGAPPFAGGRADTRGLKAQPDPPHGRDHAGVPACRLSIAFGVVRFWKHFSCPPLLSS